MPIVMLYFILFALSLGFMTQTFAPYALLRPAPVVVTYGARGWRVAT